MQRFTNIKKQIEYMHGDEHYATQKCQIALPQDTLIEAYSVDTELCPVDMDQNLINNYGQSWRKISCMML